MPDIKTDRPDRAVCVGCQEIAVRMEVAMDEGVSRKEGDVPCPDIMVGRHDEVRERRLSQPVRTFRTGLHRGILQADVYSGFNDLYSEA